MNNMDFAGKVLRIAVFAGLAGAAFALALFFVGTVDEYTPKDFAEGLRLLALLVLTLPIIPSFALQSVSEFVWGIILGTITGLLIFAISAGLIGTQAITANLAFAVFAAFILPGWLIWTVACFTYYVFFLFGQFTIWAYGALTRRKFA